jgi:hypothetical protein
MDKRNFTFDLTVPATDIKNDNDLQPNYYKKLDTIIREDVKDDSVYYIFKKQQNEQISSTVVFNVFIHFFHKISYKQFKTRIANIYDNVENVSEAPKFIKDHLANWRKVSPKPYENVDGKLCTNPEKGLKRKHQTEAQPNVDPGFRIFEFSMCSPVQFLEEKQAEFESKATKLPRVTVISYILGHRTNDSNIIIEGIIFLHSAIVGSRFKLLTSEFGFQKLEGAKNLTKKYLNNWKRDKIILALYQNPACKPTKLLTFTTNNDQQPVKKRKRTTSQELVIKSIKRNDGGVAYVRMYAHVNTNADDYHESDDVAMLVEGNSELLVKSSYERNNACVATIESTATESNSVNATVINGGGGATFPHATKVNQSVLSNDNNDDNADNNQDDDVHESDDVDMPVTENSELLMISSDEPNNRCVIAQTVVNDNVRTTESTATDSNYIHTTVVNDGHVEMSGTESCNEPNNGCAKKHTVGTDNVTSTESAASDSNCKHATVVNDEDNNHFSISTLVVKNSNSCQMSNSVEAQNLNSCDVSIVQSTLKPMNTTESIDVPIPVRIPDNNADGDEHIIIDLPVVTAQEVAIDKISNNTELVTANFVVNDTVSSTESTLIDSNTMQVIVTNDEEEIFDNNADRDEDAIIVVPDVNTEDVAVNTISNNSSKCEILINSSAEINSESVKAQNVINHNVSSTESTLTYWKQTMNTKLATEKDEQDKKVHWTPVQQLAVLVEVRIVSLL